MKQTNPNWKAFLFLTDPRPFASRLQEIIRGFNDPHRIVYFDVDPAHRPPVRTPTCTMTLYADVSLLCMLLIWWLFRCLFF
jgi:hypothetical protein